MLHARFQDHRTFGSVEEDFEGFYLIWAWRLSWSCYLGHLYKLSLDAHMKFGFDWPSIFREVD